MKYSDFISKTAYNMARKADMDLIEELERRLPATPEKKIKKKAISYKKVEEKVATFYEEFM